MKIPVLIDETNEIESVEISDISVAVGRGIWGHDELAGYASRNPQSVFAGSRDSQYNAIIGKPNTVVLHSYMVR